MSNIYLVLVILINLRLLTTSRISSCINWVALQGTLLGLYGLTAHWSHVNAELLGLAAFSIVLKGYFFPRVLHRSLRGVKAMREITPFVGYIPSLLIGLAALALCQWIGHRLPLPDYDISKLAMPVTLFSVFCGLFLITGRKKIVMQAVGYLVIDNGIFALGISAFPQTSLLVELGLLLNLCVAVFVRGIMIYNLSRVFHHMDSHQLSTLKG